MNFGQILQRERTAAGLTQAALAERCGVPLGTIREYEQGKREPLLGTAAKLARGLGKPLDLFAEYVQDGPATAGDAASAAAPTPATADAEPKKKAAKGKGRKKG